MKDNFGTSRYDYEKEAYITNDIEGFAIDEEVLFACYDIDGYEGNAYVLLQKDGKLYEVDAYHCSCYGLEDGWQPKEVPLAYLKNRKFLGIGGDAEGLKALSSLLENL
jgi:hypothetical protein